MKNDHGAGDDRQLEAERSPAAATPVAQHEDDLSPAKALRESSASGGGQRLGDRGPVANPITSFPGEAGEPEPV